jgi:hypothetical protein
MSLCVRVYVLARERVCVLCIVSISFDHGGMRYLRHNALLSLHG